MAAAVIHLNLIVEIEGGRASVMARSATKKLPDAWWSMQRQIPGGSWNPLAKLRLYDRVRSTPIAR